jgi:hypothetical protein
MTIQNSLHMCVCVRVVAYTKSTGTYRHRDKKLEFQKIPLA